jgi:hypothetical protein
LFASVLLLSAAVSGAEPKKGSGSEEKDASVRNAVGFHILDFVAWNNRDWNVFRHYHTKDVKVVSGGQTTEGIEAHVKAMQGMLQSPQMAESRILQHLPTVAAGNWTCVVGVSPGPGAFSMATVAKWRDGAISEEYLFMRQLPAGTPPPSLSGEPIARLKNQSSSEVSGTEQGWSCTFGRGANGKGVVIFAKSENGKDVPKLIFAD